MKQERKPDENCVASERLYEGKILNLRVDRVAMPSGRKARREVVEHRSAAGALALTERGTVLLVKQYRYAVGETTLEVCAGLLEEGEEPRAAIEREMQEELGVKPGRLQEIAGFYASPGFCTEFLHLYLAEDLTESSLPQDEDENVRVCEVPFADIPKMLAEGVFRDSKTVAALAWLMAREGLRPQAGKEV